MTQPSKYDTQIKALKDEIENLRAELASKEKINAVLMSRVERSVDSAGDSYALFENNILLQQHVERRTREMAELNEKLIEEIDERKQIERDLEKSRDAAIQASKAKSQFLANMSHEIRTPMNGVLGMAGLLLQSELSDKQIRHLEIIKSSGDSLLNILNDILDFSKMEAGKLTLESIDFSLHHAVEEVMDTFSVQAELKGLELACFIAHDVPIVLRGDPSRLRQILTNLVGNGVKFTERGEVVVRLSVDEISDKDVRLRFEVQDTGAGVEEDAIEEIFELFSQADGSTTRKHGGTGLGLTIGKQLAEMMDGEMGVESTSGRGSNFWFTVRLDKQRVSHQEVTTPRYDLDGVRALIVDDNDVNRAILEEQLAGWGLNSTAVSNGPDALKELVCASKEGKPYDLAILDIIMPGMDGMELAREIEKDGNLRGTKLIMLTSVGMKGDAQEAKLARAAAYLTKPVRQSELLLCIATVMGQKTDAVSSPLVTRHSLAENKVRFAKKILLAEDTLVNQEVALEMLEFMGCDVDIVDNGLKALDAFSEKQYDLVFMDCQMPEMDGYEATRAIRLREQEGSVPRRIPIIALTAHAMPGDKEQCLAAGMDDYVSKPFGLNKLRSVLEKWLPGDLKNATQENATHQEVHFPAMETSEQLNQAGTAEDQTPPSLDPGALDSIRALQRQGKPDIVNKVIGIYLSEAPKFIERLRDAIPSGNAKALKDAAHSFKSNSANVGATLLAEMCRQLETMAKENNTRGGPELLSEVETEYQRVEAALKRVNS